MRKSVRPTSRPTGFTLLEVMIVIGIILLVLGIVGVNLLGSRDDAKKDVARIQMKTLHNGLRDFYLKFDRYPTEEEGIAVLWDRDLMDDASSEDGGEDKWRMFVDEPVESDPWGSEWGYTDEAEDEDRPFELWSIGPDKEEDSDDDIYLFGDGEDEDGFGDFASDEPM